MLFGCHLENSNTILQRHKRLFGYSDIFVEFLFENRNKNTAFVFFSPRLNQGEQQKFNEKNNKSIEFHFICLADKLRLLRIFLKVPNEQNMQIK